MTGNCVSNTIGSCQPYKVHGTEAYVEKSNQLRFLMSEAGNS